MVSREDIFGALDEGEGKFGGKGNFVVKKIPFPKIFDGAAVVDIKSTSPNWVGLIPAFSSAFRQARNSSTLFTRVPWKKIIKNFGIYFFTPKLFKKFY